MTKSNDLTIKAAFLLGHTTAFILKKEKNLFDMIKSKNG